MDDIIKELQAIAQLLEDINNKTKVDAELKKATLKDIDLAINHLNTIYRHFKEVL